MFNENVILQKLRKNRIMMLVGIPIIAVLLAATVFVSVRIVSDREQLIFESRASYTAEVAATQFRELIDSGIAQTRIARSGSNPSSEQMLAPFEDSEIFCGAALVDACDRIVKQIGTVSEFSVSDSVIRYTQGDTNAYICIGANGTIALKVSAGRRYYLKAYLRPELIDALFCDDAGTGCGYCFYIASTGAYVLNRTHFTQSAYYDSLLERNGEGETESLLCADASEVTHAVVTNDSTFSDGTYYIAQAPTGIENLNLAVTISGKQLAGALEVRKYDIRIVCGIICALFLLVLAFALHFIRNTNIVAKLVGKNLRSGELLLRRATDGAQMTLMLYNPSDDSFTAYYESGAERKRNAGAAPRSMRELATRYGISDEDTERIYKTCRGLRCDERASVNLNVVRKGAERCLHLHMHMSSNDIGRIICSLHDCTRDAISDELAKQEDAFRAAMLPRCVSVWEINATEDRWRAAHRAENAGAHTPDVAQDPFAWRDYDADLRGRLRDVIHPDDYADYIGAVDSTGLTRMYQGGKYEYIHEYRVRPDSKNDYEWHRQTVRIHRDQENGDILAVLYVTDINAERMAEAERRARSRALQQTLTALGATYYALYYVELDRDVCITARAPGGEILTSLERPYRATFDRYIDRRVAQEDRERIRGMLSAYMLRKTLTEKEHLQYTQFTRVNDVVRERIKLIVRAARFENGTVRDVVIALRIMDDE